MDWRMIKRAGYVHPSSFKQQSPAALVLCLSSLQAQMTVVRGMIRHKVLQDTLFLFLSTKPAKAPSAVRIDKLIGSSRIRYKAEDPIGGQLAFSAVAAGQIAHSDGQSEADAGLNSASCATST